MKMAAACGCARACGVHGHGHARGWGAGRPHLGHAVLLGCARLRLLGGAGWPPSNASPCGFSLARRPCREGAFRPPFASLTIAPDLPAPLMILTGRYRWAGALALAAFTLMATSLANRFPKMAGPKRFGATNAFFKDLGLVGAFLLVA